MLPSVRILQIGAPVPAPMIAPAVIAPAVASDASGRREEAGTAVRARDGRADPAASRRRGRPPPRADRILVIRLGALGDVVRTLPAVAALRAAYPGAHLAWLVEPGAAGVVQAAQLVDETLIFPRQRLVEALEAGDGLSVVRMLRDFVVTLRRRRFEIVLDFHGLLKSGLFARLTGAPLRVGFDAAEAREGAHLFVNRRVGLPARRLSRFRRNAALVETLVPRPQWPSKPLLRPTDLAVARLAARLRVSGRDRVSGFVLIHPGASRGARHKRYPVSGWARLCQALAEDGFEVWLAAGAAREERRLADRILRATRGAVIQAPETRSFDDLLALVTRAAVFVSGDTGPLHAASLAGVPVVQLMGPTDPVQNAPWPGTAARRCYVPLPCSPCRRGCAAAPCMKSLSPRSIAWAVRDLCEATPSWNRVAAQPAEESGA